MYATVFFKLVFYRLKIKFKSFKAEWYYKNCKDIFQATIKGNNYSQQAKRFHSGKI